MPMHISPAIDTGPDRIAAMFPIANSLSLATHSDILGILQREQDRAVALLSSSPLLASLFVSYANQAAAIQSATPSTEAEEWKALEQTISTLQEDIDKLKPENLKMTENLEAATASLDAFRSQVASLKEVISQQQQDLDSLRAGLSEFKDKCNRLVKDLNAERENFQSTVSDFAVERAELKETIVQQQLKISRLERQGSGSPSNGPLTAVAEAIVKRKPDEPEDRRHALREEKQQDEQGPRENTHLQVEKMGEEKSQGPLPPALRWTVGMNSDHSRGISQKERKGLWSDVRRFNSTDEDEPSAPPSIINSLVPGGTFDARKINSFLKEDPPCGSGVVDPRTPLTKKGNDIDILASPSAVVTPIPSARFPAPTGNLSLPHREQLPPSTGSPCLSPTPEATLKVSQKSTSKLLETPKDVAEQVLMAPKCPLPPSFLSTAKRRVTTPASSPAKVETEKPLSLLERATELKPVTSAGGNGGGNERRVDQRENMSEGPWSNDRFRAPPAQSKITTKRTSVSEPAPAPVRSSGWGSSLLQAVTASVAEWSPPPVKPEIVDPTRRYTPNTLPASRPAGLNKPALGASGPGDNTRGVVIDSLRDTALESGSSSTPGLGTGKSVTVDTTTTFPGSHPNAVESKNISELAVKHGAGLFEISAPPPVEMKVPEQPAEEAELPAKETPNPTGEDEFDDLAWAKAGKKKKNRGVTSSVPDLYPDPGTTDDLLAGGAEAKKKKKGKR